MTSIKLSHLKEGEVYNPRVVFPQHIYAVRYSATDYMYSGRRYNSTEDVYLHVSWLNNNSMEHQWRQTTICAHPGQWFRVPPPARTKQTAVLCTKDQ